MKVLTVLTSRDQLGNTDRKTGFWLAELATPYTAVSYAQMRSLTSGR
jgi:hypothetical protein